MRHTGLRVAVCDRNSNLLAWSLEAGDGRAAELSLSAQTGRAPHQTPCHLSPPPHPHRRSSPCCWRHYRPPRTTWHTPHMLRTKTHTLKMDNLLQFTLSLVTKSNLRLGGNLILSVLRFVFVIWSRLATTKYHDLSITDLTCFYHLVSSHVLIYYRGFKQHTTDQLHFLYNQNKSCRNN